MQAVLDRHEIDEQRRRILTSLLIAGGVGVLLAALVAAFLARRAMTPLSQSLAMQRRFVADASHELRTPLTLLSTRLQMVARRARQPGSRLTGDDLDGVLADTGRLTDILDDLLLAADTRNDSHRAPTDLASLVRECVDAASGAADVAAVRLRCEADGPVVVDGVEPALRRAVTALVDNALDHAAHRVDVRVEAARPHRPGGRCADDGPGIAAEVRPRVFERFTQRADRRGGRVTPALRDRAGAGRRRRGRPRRDGGSREPHRRRVGRGARPDAAAPRAWSDTCRSGGHP